MATKLPGSLSGFGKRPMEFRSPFSRVSAWSQARGVLEMGFPPCGGLGWMGPGGDFTRPSRSLRAGARGGGCRPGSPASTRARLRLCRAVGRTETRAEGRQRWTVRLLAEKLVELKIADCVSTMTVQRSLKKRTAASPEQILEDPARRRRGVRRGDGRCAGGLPTATRSAFPRRVHG